MKQVTRRSPIFSKERESWTVTSPFAGEDVPRPDFHFRKEDTETSINKPEPVSFGLDSYSLESEGEEESIVKPRIDKKHKKQKMTDEEKMTQLSERRRQARKRKETNFEMPKPPIKLMEEIENKQEIHNERPSQRRNLIQIKDGQTRRSIGTPKPIASHDFDQPRELRLSSNRTKTEVDSHSVSFSSEKEKESKETKIVNFTEEAEQMRTKRSDGVKDTPRPPRKPKPNALEPDPTRQEQPNKRKDDVKDTPRPIRKSQVEETPKKKRKDDVKDTPRPIRKNEVEETPKKKRTKSVSKKATVEENGETEKGKSPRGKVTKSHKPKRKYNWFSSDDDDLSTDDIVSMPPESDGEHNDDLPIALRRTKRVRVKPLRFWRGEKIVYRLADDDGLPCFGSVHRVLKREDK